MRYKAETTLIKVLSDGKFTSKDSAGIAHLYGWYDTVPELLESPAELRRRIELTNGVHGSDIDG